MSDPTYAGDVSPKEAWEILQDDPRAVLIDVRTDAEFAYVGVPDLSALGKELVCIPWKVFPAMDVDPGFSEKLATTGIEKETVLLFLCRSGVRSRHAAERMTAEGFTRCFNISYGFEGDRDSSKHRGTKNGWKVDGLPWVQG